MIYQIEDVILLSTYKMMGIVKVLTYQNPYEENGPPGMAFVKNMEPIAVSYKF